MKNLSKNKDGCAIAAELLKALAHPLRLRIIAILCEGDCNVGSLAEQLGVSQPIVSQQLRLLRMKELVSVTRENGYALYRLAESHLPRMVECLQGCIDERRRR